MKIDTLVNIYRACGCRIKKKYGQYFLSQGLLSYSFPLLNDIPVNKNLIDSIKWKSALSIIKTNTNIKNTYEYILESNDYSINKFSKKPRNRIRKSLKDCIYKKPSIDDMLYFGYKINKQTMARQGRYDRILTCFKHWEQHIKAIYSHDDINILGAYTGEKMVGYLAVYELTGKHIIMHAYYDREASAAAPMNGLLYTMITRLINENGTINISYGVESFKYLPELNRFKKTMLFQRIPTTRVYLINPAIEFFTRLIISFYLQLLKRKKINNSFIQNLIRLYQGHRILDKSIY